MWKCMRCETENPDDTLQCHECGLVDPLASREELAVWQGALQGELEREPVRPPRVRGGLVVAILLITPIIFKAIAYSKSLNAARRFESASSCHGSGGLGMPSPPCSTEAFSVDHGHTLGFGEVPMKGHKTNLTIRDFFVADLVDATGHRRDVGVLDDATLTNLIDHPEVTAVEYYGKIVGLDGSIGYVETTDNPSVILSMDRTELIEIVGFVGFVALVFVGIDASGRYAARRKQAMYDRRGSSRR